MRRFSSEGSLLDLDFLPWKTISMKHPEHRKSLHSDAYTPHLESDELDGGIPGRVPIIQETKVTSSDKGKTVLSREHSISVENLSERGNLAKNHLEVCAINEGCRAYSDSQLAPNAEGPDGVEQDDHTPSPSAYFNSLFNKPNDRHHHRAKLSAAKLHLKSLFGQSPHSSNPNLSNTVEKDSATERRSRLHFMHQWSQVGLGKKRKFSREDLEKWAESLDSLLASHTGVSVFGAFLRSEFSEENLQFYLACEEYSHSSNNFSLQRRARDISATYIQAGSPREVNLDSKTRDLTLQLLQAPSRSSLQHAQKRIYSLLDTDCYPRFLQSNIYLCLLQEAE
ncbi:regulator of G-protein signaling 1 [Austrofundulus limnaeus]|uniref:Regulator of G-protein signaling 1 n=1 Tax=Austrofundulus limnaeus TaxID=52670 RepID=A0A2I4CQD9_AUSLI|nr:PREDICTED: regulator of G-protein signaling 1-like [Austrofundulus limnaeus]